LDKGPRPAIRSRRDFRGPQRPQLQSLPQGPLAPQVQLSPQRQALPHWQDRAAPAQVKLLQMVLKVFMSWFSRMVGWPLFKGRHSAGLERNS
jgi:hypothetical protein